MIDAPICIDFETEAINDRPRYPPKPVGVAVWIPGQAPKYLAWGHPSGNNSTFEDGTRLVRNCYDSGLALAFHNSKFDLDVAREHMGLEAPHWSRCHDTQVLAFLDDPRTHRLGLKPLAEKHLNEAPTERDVVRDWVVENIPNMTKASKNWGAHIGKAPVELVGPYAIGDVTRTRGLFDKFVPRVLGELDMGVAYARELQLIPILLENERLGVRVDLSRLEADVEFYQGVLDGADAWIRQTLRDPDLNIDSDAQLADALERMRMIRLDAQGRPAWILTEKGNRSTARGNLAKVITDQRFAAVHAYRGILATCLNTFLKPWLKTARITGGRVHFNWNSIMQDEGGGARTGRLSSSPNGQNIPTLETTEKVWKAALAQRFEVPELPRVRSYIIADEGHILIGRDFNGQELRITAHYEDAGMKRAYIEQPSLDLHAYAATLISANMGLDLSRKDTKITAFSLIYGAGGDTIAERLGTTREQALRVKKAYLKTFPGLEKLMEALKNSSKRGESLRTWGGRVYWAEDAKVIKGKLRDFHYKQLNLLIQGSAADMTKELIIRYRARAKHSRMLLNVHDELLLSAHLDHWRVEMTMLREEMESLELDVPILSDGEVGENWGAMEECS